MQQNYIDIAKPSRRPIHVTRTEYKEVIRIFTVYGQMCRGQEKVDSYIATQAVNDALGALSLQYD